jgi:hypothetical protein
VTARLHDGSGEKCLINNRARYLHGSEADSGGWSDGCKGGSLRDRDDDYP